MFSKSLKLSIVLIGAALFLAIPSMAASFESVISKNPRGQILEPGFRIVFPVPR